MVNTTCLFFFTFLIAFNVFSQEIEKDLIFCTFKHNEEIQAKLTKTNDQLYSLYALSNAHEISEWEKIMDLMEPVIWTKNSVGEIADFYSTESYSYWLRLELNNNFHSLGNGEFLTPQENKKTKEMETVTYQFINCKGKLE